MSVNRLNLLPEPDSTNSWARHFGDHEDAGFSVYRNAKSAHVTLGELGVEFAVCRQDVPAAWAVKIEPAQLRFELIATLVRRMSPEIVEVLFRELRDQSQRAFRAGEDAARDKIKEALGLC